MAKKIVVTGGNSGIGLALCRQLAVECGCHVYLGARSIDKGQAAVKEILDPAPSAKVEFLQVDVGSDASVKSAAETLGSTMGSEKLYAVVNNAGLISEDAGAMVNTNLFGVKRMCESFLPLVDSCEGRIVNVGSGAGPGYVKKLSDPEVKKQLCSEDQSWAKIEAHLKSCNLPEMGNFPGYGLSKALLTNYTSLLAKENPNLKINVCSPGWIATNFGGGGSKAPKGPEEGTPAIKHLLFGELAGNGWYYGSDAVRSPLHYMRDPGTPAYDGVVPDVFS